MDFLPGPANIPEERAGTTEGRWRRGVDGSPEHVLAC
jgi:hypothetical protein